MARARYQEGGLNPGEHGETLMRVCHFRGPMGLPERLVDELAIAANTDPLRWPNVWITTKSSSHRPGRPPWCQSLLHQDMLISVCGANRQLGPGERRRIWPPRRRLRNRTASRVSNRVGSVCGPASGAHERPGTAQGPSVAPSDTSRMRSLRRSRRSFASPSTRLGRGVGSDSGALRHPTPARGGPDRRAGAPAGCVGHGGPSGHPGPPSSPGQRPAAQRAPRTRLQVAPDRWYIKRPGR
jgi:hypothetical protein